MSSEDVFQDKIIQDAHDLNLLVFHSTDSRRDIGAGFPDLVLAGPGGHLFAELKTTNGRMTPDQTTWAWRLRASGAPYTVWTPHDWREIWNALAEMATA
jgi:VRR-NUC domain